VLGYRGWRWYESKRARKISNISSFESHGAIDDASDLSRIIINSMMLLVNDGYL